MKTSSITLLLLISFPRRGLIRWQSSVWYDCTHYNSLQLPTWWLTDPRDEIWARCLVLWGKHLSRSPLKPLQWLWVVKGAGDSKAAKNAFWWRKQSRYRWNAICSRGCFQVQRCCWAPWLSEQICELGNEAHTGDRIISSLDKAFSISGTPEPCQKHKNGFNVFMQWIDLFLLKPALR